MPVCVKARWLAPGQIQDGWGWIRSPLTNSTVWCNNWSSSLSFAPFLSLSLVLFSLNTVDVGSTGYALMTDEGEKDETTIFWLCCVIHTQKSEQNDCSIICIYICTYSAAYSCFQTCLATQWYVITASCNRTETGKPACSSCNLPCCRCFPKTSKGSRT